MITPSSPSRPKKRLPPPETTKNTVSLAWPFPSLLPYPCLSVWRSFPRGSRHATPCSTRARGRRGGWTLGPRPPCDASFDRPLTTTTLTLPPFFPPYSFFLPALLPLGKAAARPKELSHPRGSSTTTTSAAKQGEGTHSPKGGAAEPYLTHTAADTGIHPPTSPRPAPLSCHLVLPLRLRRR